MDDLDHSIHIAEYDWTSFFEECEECGLLQPSLACPDNLSLSDSEEQENSSSVFSAGQRGPQQRPAANGDEAESDAAGQCVEEVQINQSGSGEEGDLATKAQADSEICLDSPEGNAIKAEETNDSITTALQAERPNLQPSDGESTELKREDGGVQTESDACELVQEPDPLSRNQTDPNVTEPHTADRAAGKDGSGVALRAEKEKERWFVTVNDSPARQRARAPSVKKKRRQKKPCKGNHMCRTPRQEKPLENSLELEINRDYDESEGGGDAEHVAQSKQNSVKKSGGYPSAEENISDVSQMSGEEDHLSEKLATSHSPKENIIESTTDGNKHDPIRSSVSPSQDTFTLKDPSRLDSAESDEFLSTHSYDSESYLSAAESVEEPQHPLVEDQQLQSPTNSHLFSLPENTDAAADR